MKTKIILVVSLVLLTILSSCKKDDQNDVVNSVLIGTWAESPSTEQFIFTFGADGEGSFQCKNCSTDQILTSTSFMYVFNPLINEISISGFDEINLCYVKFIGKKSIQLYRDAAYTDQWSYVMFK